MSKGDVYIEKGIRISDIGLNAPCLIQASEADESGHIAFFVVSPVEYDHEQMGGCDIENSRFIVTPRSVFSDSSGFVRNLVIVMTRKNLIITSTSLFAISKAQFAFTLSEYLINKICDCALESENMTHEQSKYLAH